MLSEQQKMEQEAHVILLKHENEKKEKQLEVLDREHKQLSSKYKEIQELLQREQEEVKFSSKRRVNYNTWSWTMLLQKAAILSELEEERTQHNIVQNSLSQELLNSAKLRSQLEDLRILQAQDIM